MNPWITSSAAVEQFLALVEKHLHETNEQKQLNKQSEHKYPIKWKYRHF